MKKNPITLSEAQSNPEAWFRSRMEARSAWGTLNPRMEDTSGGTGGEGGSTSSNASGDGSNGASGGTGTPGGETPPAGSPDPADGEKKPWGSDEDFNPEKAWNLIKNLRADKEQFDAKLGTAVEAAKTEAKTEGATSATSSILSALAEGFGLESTDEKPVTIEDVLAAHQSTVERLSELETEITTAKLTQALSDSLKEHGGDPDLAVPYLQGKGLLNDLDPSAEDFQEKLTAAVKGALDSQPKLRVQAQDAGSGGVDLSGKQGQGAVTKEQFRAMSNTERNDLYHRNPALYKKLSGN